MVSEEVINHIKKFQQELNEIPTISELYQCEICIVSQYYYLELNPVHIHEMRLIDDELLRLILPNKRLIELKLTDDFEIKRKKKNVG